MQGRIGQDMPEFKRWWKQPQPRFRDQPRTLNHRLIILIPHHHTHTILIIKLKAIIQSHLRSMD